MPEVIISHRALLDFTREVLRHFGLPPDDAEVQADVLVWANLRGVDSHGVLRLPDYLRWTRAGRLNPRPNIEVRHETAATMMVEADRAFGGVVTTFAMNKAISKARKVGIGWAVIRDSGHKGAMGYYSLMAAREDMAGIAIASTVRNLAPYGAKAAGISNCPIAIAVPAKRHRPLLLDMATSVVAAGKIFLAQDKGVLLPRGWALDKEGNPATDPHRVAALLPAGGPKGSGLALMLECLTSVMVDNSLLGYGPSPEPSYRGRSNGLVAAIDISVFADLDTYKENVDALIDNVKSLPKADGFTEILVPDEWENRIEEDRRKRGIPLPQGTVRNLRDMAQELRVPLPAELRQ